MTQKITKVLAACLSLLLSHAAWADGIFNPGGGGSSSLVINTNPITGGTNGDILQITAGKLGSVTVPDCKSATSAVTFDGTAKTFGCNVFGTSATLGANTFTGTQTINPAANTNALLVSGFSLTGSDVHALMDLSGTLNTSGTVPGVFVMRVTDTAHGNGGTTKLFQIFAGVSGTTSEFAIDPSGNVNATGGMTVGANGTYTSVSGVVQLGTLGANDTLIFVNNSDGITLKATTKNVILSSTTDATASSGAAALQVSGGASVAKRFWLPAITTSSGLQTAVLCQSSGGEVIADSVACLASSERFKDIVGPSRIGLSEIMAMRPIIYRYKPTGNERFDSAPNQRTLHAGLNADEVARIDPHLVAYDADGQVRTIREDSIIAGLIGAIQEQQAQINDIKSRLQ